MKLATFGPFVVSARAIPHNESWRGLFTLHKYEGTSAKSLCLLADHPINDIYANSDAAIDAAFLEGREHAFAEARRQNDPRTTVSLATA